MNFQNVSNERLRSFYPEVVGTGDTEHELLGWLNDGSRKLENDSDATRLVAQAVLGTGAVKRLVQEASGLVPVEAAIPIRAKGDESGLWLVYFGINKPERQPEPRQLLNHLELLKNIRNCAPGPRILNSTGIDIKRVDPNNSEHLVEGFSALYDVFDFDENETRDMLADPNRAIFYVADAEGCIISTSMVEELVTPVDGLAGGLATAEITEAVTNPRYRGKGLYTAISGVAIRSALEKNHVPYRIIYGESNASSPGVIKAAIANGRTPVSDYAEQFGASPDSFGILPQNIKVEDGINSHPYNDFIVSHI